MALFDMFKSRSTVVEPDRLYGRWKLSKVEGDLDIDKNATVEFKRNGSLDYCIAAGDKVQIVKLVFRIEGNVLITDQPSAPSEQRTAFAFDEKGHLVLDYGTSRTWFVKLAS